MDEQKIWDIIARLTLEEKAALCGGADSWTTKANPEKGVPPLSMADGPHGVRKADKANAAQNGGPSVPATCFPPAVAMASSWDVALMREVGRAMGAEARDQDVRVLLGPGTNLKRSPLCGRNFEYFSEDPLLSGRFAAAWIEGVQSQKVGASLKHFALNSQETKRMSISAAVDERALFDLYLRPFKLAVQSAKPDTVMASYNKIDGVYSCDNRRLLTDILRLRFGFEGLVMSDWGAEDRRDAGIAAGLDLEMPASFGAGEEAVVAAVRDGSLSEDALDTACWNVLRLVLKYAEDTSEKPPCDYDAHHELAAAALAKCAVLLKNEGDLLPFSAEKPVCVIGEMAEKPHFQGGGSSIVNPRKLTGFLDALGAAGQPFEYHPGYRGYETNSEMMNGAVAAAQRGGQVVLFLGLPDYYDCEGYDREHLRLPDFQLKLLSAVAAVNRNICVVVCTGGVLETPWIDGVRALLCPYVGGQAAGEGVRRLLFGLANPSGKLAESWPMALQDTPCYHYFPMGPREVTHNESLYVGYRYYDTAGIPVRFPFGYGLSYTRFAYGGPRLGAALLAKDEALQVYFTVENTGAVPGEEVCQVYLARKGSAMWQPAHELAGFARVALAPGEKKTVQVSLPPERFACYDPASGTFVTEAGEYEIQVGPSSRELPLKMAVQAKGVQLSPIPTYARDGAYGHIVDNSFSQQAFAPVYGKQFIGNVPRQKGEYTMDTTLGEMHHSGIVRFFKKRALSVGRKQMNFSKDPLAAEKALCCGVDDLPFKNLVSFSRGVVSPGAAAALLKACNGQGGLFTALRLVLKNWRHLKDLMQ